MKKKGLHILFAMSGTSAFVLGVLGPYYVIFVERIGGSIELAGISLAAFSIASGVLILAFSVWESSVKDQRMLYAVGYLLRATVFIMYLFVGSFYELILTQILLGISVALINPSFDSLFTKHTSMEQAISDWGAWEGLIAIMTGVASIAGAYLIQMFGFGPLFMIMGGLTAACGFYLLLLPKDTL